MWGEWARFVRRPVLPVARQSFDARAIVEVGQLLALTIAFDMALVVGLSWLAARVGIKTPQFAELTRYALREGLSTLDSPTAAMPAPSQ